jgi:hypothetical protein
MGLGALVNVAILRISFARMVGPLEGVARWRGIGSLLVANAALGGLVWVAWWGLTPLLDRAAGVSAQLLLAALLLPVITIGFFAYTGVLRALRYPGAELLWGLPRKLYRRLRGA